ncbi:MAG: hypothetical protein M3256_25650 [Actinomycetota bacterium]|nr:hypothetical protein [Actinomycetota bacterium]MDQ6949541.1 hypothetical protein [Actinomycetota bacterium]
MFNPDPSCAAMLLSIAATGVVLARDQRGQYHALRGRGGVPIWGGPYSAEFGQYWTPIDPRTSDPTCTDTSPPWPDRVNDGTELTIGVINDVTGIVGPQFPKPVSPNVSYPSLPFTSQTGVAYRTYDGGTAEYIIPNAPVQVACEEVIPLPTPYGGRPGDCGYAPRGCYGE